ncbi:conserved hypothetical protein [Klenkia marina]|uniref:SnoaL-like domain-containing protein n=1 Tax=Klenkia marina TaxID=1960309 RepID=A0A1G4XTN8_9ACTN|nr:nuclear transport factor 2 family protein [Klenkia marina]SCX44485.1 conserved hypothetical protein [Klenkia marina]
MSRDDDVLAALDRLVAAFGAGDEEAYFACIAPEATFVLPGYPRYGSREEYRAAWRSWVADGFAVLGCTSTDRHVQWVGETALVTHRVRTAVRVGDDHARTVERETVVLAQVDGPWLVVHEHLSPAEENSP